MLEKKKTKKKCVSNKKKSNVTIEFEGELRKGLLCSVGVSWFVTYVLTLLSGNQF